MTNDDDDAPDAVPDYYHRERPTEANAVIALAHLPDNLGSEVVGALQNRAKHLKKMADRFPESDEASEMAERATHLERMARRLVEAPSAEALDDSQGGGV